MRISFLICAVGLWLPVPVYAQDHCSLIVRVLTPAGRRPAAPVIVKEQGGRVEESEQGTGDVRFCDLGILPVTVTVGSGGLCNQVTVRDVRGLEP